MRGESKEQAGLCSESRVVTKAEFDLAPTMVFLGFFFRKGMFCKHLKVVTLQIETCRCISVYFPPIIKTNMLRFSLENHMSWPHWVHISLWQEIARAEH